MKKPAKQFYLWWAIETPKKHLLIHTVAQSEKLAWEQFIFRGDRGIEGKEEAKEKGYEAVRVVIHKPQVSWDPIRSAPELNIHSR